MAGWITLAPQTTASAPVSAAADLSFETALGQAKPIFRGTMPFKFYPTYGRGARKTTQVAVEQETTSISWGHIGGGGLMQPATTSYTTKETVVCDMFCTGPRNRFGNDIELLQIKLNDDIVYDKVAGIKSVDFRFYNGLDNVVDPLVLDITGSDTGSSHIGDCCLVFENLDCSKYSDRPPVVTAILSDAADDAAHFQESITGAYGNTDWSLFNSAYDSVDGFVYQFVNNQNPSGTNTVYVLDVGGRRQISSFAIDYGEFGTQMVPIPGSGYLLIEGIFDDVQKTNLVDAESGAVIASATLPGFTEFIFWAAVMQAPDGKFLAFGTHNTITDGTDCVIAIIDITESSVTLVPVAMTADTYASPGPASQQVFYTDRYSGSWGNPTTVSAVTHRDGAVSIEDIYTVPSGYIRGLLYDPETGYLVIPTSVPEVLIIDPLTGTLIRTVATDVAFDQDTFEQTIRQFPKRGNVILLPATGNTIYSLNLTSFVISTYAEPFWSDPEEIIVDQTRSLWLEYSEDLYPPLYWGVFTAGGGEPGSITLESLLTSLYELADFDAAPKVPEYPSLKSDDGFADVYTARSFTTECLGAIVPAESILLIQKSVEPKPGDLVSFCVRSTDEGEERTPVFVKLLGAPVDNDQVVGIQLNPPKCLAFPRDQVVYVHTVLAVYRPDGSIFVPRPNEFAKVRHLVSSEALGEYFETVKTGNTSSPAT